MDEYVKRFGNWLGDITNLAALLTIIVVISEAFNPNRSRLVLLAALGALILIVLLKYADVGRFKGAITSADTIPPLGLARGSVRAFLAFGFLLGFGLYIYYATATTKNFQKEIFMALSSIISVVIGFYFGAKTAASAQQAAQKLPPPEVAGIEPKRGKAGKKFEIKNLAGTGFQTDTTVSLVKGAEKILAEDVKVVQPTKITCFFDLPQITQKEAWDIVVINPDGQKAILPGGFEIEP